MTLTITQVSQLYVSVLGRAAEGDGSNYWQTNINSTNMGAIADIMLQTDEAQAYFGSTFNDNQAFIEHIYLNTLGMTYAQDPHGVDFWVTQLENGWTKAGVIVSIIDAVQRPENAGPAQDQFNNKIEVSNYAAQNLPECNDLTTFSNFIQGVTHDNAVVSDAFTAIDHLRDTYFPKNLPHDNISLPSDLHVNWVNNSEITSIPHDAIGLIIRTLDGQSYLGTGFMISPEHVLTSAHVLLDDAGKLSSTADISFTPGLNGNINTADQYDWQQVWVEKNFDSALYPQWPDNDLGIIKLDHPVDNMKSFLNLEPDISLNLAGSSVQSTGYPGGGIEQENLATPGPDFYQWGVTGTIDQYIFDNGGVELSQSMNTTAGSSGSPVYYSRDNAIYFTGVLSGTIGKATVAAAIDQDSHNWILGVLQQDGYYLDYTLV